jgi:cobalt-zinc-cadmium efflux system outer membrane protein
MTTTGLSRNSSRAGVEMNRDLLLRTAAAWGLILLFPYALYPQNSFQAPAPAVHGAMTALAEPGRPDTEPVLGGAQVNLQDLLQVALTQNPAIKSATQRFEAQRARVAQARSLPDPTFSGGWMGNITPFSVQLNDPSSYRGLTVAEDFPSPGKSKLRGQIADRDAEAAWWDYEQMRRQVASDVKVAYYDYFYYTKAIEITEKDKDLRQKLAHISEELYKVGRGMQADAFRAQVEVSRIDQKLIILHQQEDTARARLNTLLYRDPDSPLPPPAPFTPAEFHVALQSLYAQADQNDPGLERDRRMIEGNRNAVRLARKAYEPDFSVAYTYLERPLMPDMHGVMVGINIPVFYRTKQRQGVIEAAHGLIGTQRDLDDRAASVNFEIKQQYLAAAASRDLSNLYSKAIVPQSSLALESSMAAYEVGKLDFLSVLTNFVDVLDFEVGYYEEISKFQSALARLEPMVGTELTK